MNINSKFIGSGGSTYYNLYRFIISCSKKTTLYA